MREYLIRLSWPDKRLQPHAKGHWRPKAAATKAYRQESWALAVQAGVESIPNATLEFDFYPPDKRKRDLHNMPAQMKSVIDGIADAMDVDDNKFKCRWPETFAGETHGGAVVVRIRPPLIDIPILGTIS